VIAHRAKTFAFDWIGSWPSTQGAARSASPANENGPKMAAMRHVHGLEKDRIITARAAHGYLMRPSPALVLIVDARPLDDAVVRLTNAHYLSKNKLELYKQPVRNELVSARAN